MWEIDHNTILQFYTLLFNNPVIMFNHCSFTTICVHYIITQYRSSPEPQSHEPGLSPGISNPPNRASGNNLSSRAGLCPVLPSSPEPGFPPESLRSPRLSALPSRAAPGTDEFPLPRTGLLPEYSESCGPSGCPFHRLLPDKSVSTEPGSARSIVNYTIQASPGGVKSHHTGFSRRSQVHRTGLCPKLLLNHTRRASPGSQITQYGLLPEESSPPNRALPETIVKYHTTRVSPGIFIHAILTETQVLHMEA